MPSPGIRKWVGSDLGILILIACARFLLHMITNGRYGFHRDELLTLDNARHLAWGYVVYPPMTPFLARIELTLFGTSLTGFRFFPALSQALVMLLTGLSARALGGKRLAQVVAALAVAVSGHALVSGWFMSYSTFDYLWWSLVAYTVIRLLTSDDPRWWLAIGAAIALGLLTKYTMGVLVLGVVGGVLLTPVRRYLKSPWLWCGVAVCFLLVSPNLYWQWEHHFVGLDFLRNIHARDVRWGWTDYFLLNQLWKSANPVTVPVWLAGLWFVFVRPEGRRFRLLGWMYLIPLVVLFLVRGRDYYLAAAYPMLFAAGAVWGEKWLLTLLPGPAISVRQTTWYSLFFAGVSTAAVTLPVAPLNSAWFHFADRVNGGNFGHQLGWPQMVEAVARVRDALPSADLDSLRILSTDDGQTGAVNLYGPAYHLPPAISGMNSNWLRGYGEPPPRTVITLGFDDHFLKQDFESCELAADMRDPRIIENNSINWNTKIYVCRNLRKPWPEFWQQLKSYG